MPKFHTVDRIALVCLALVSSTLGSGCRLYPEFFEFDPQGPESKFDIAPEIRGTAYDPLARPVAAATETSANAR